jgi:hypothetical protein
MRLCLVLLLLPLTGCYSVVSINLGSVQHQAASPLMPPEVQCAALVGQAIKAGNIEAAPMQKICADLASQAEAAKKAKQ